ncbi:MAG: TonB family protein [Myxococcales bacterium]|nr:TonB family protein [Myxococcales bacterium]
MHPNDAFQLAPAGGAPLGLALRMTWGGRLIDQRFLRPGAPSSFSVGSGAGVDFTTPDRSLPRRRFDLVRADGRRFLLHFGERMRGELRRGPRTLSLRDAVEEELADRDEREWEVELRPGDSARIELGGVDVELSRRHAPPLVAAEMIDRLDYTALNAFLAAFFAGALFVIAAVNRAGNEEAWYDDLSQARAEIRMVQARLAEAPPNPLRERVALSTERRLAGAHKSPEGKAGAPSAPAAARRGSGGSPNSPRLALQGLFAGPGMSGVFAPRGLDGALLQALGGLSGPSIGNSAGLDGLGLRGGKDGGGGLSEGVGIGPIPTRGGGPGTVGDPQLPPLPGPQKPLIAVDPGPVVTCGGYGRDGETGACVSKDLIRQVIRRNVNQIRYCYERELVRTPHLAGKVAVRFVIGGGGVVTRSEVAHSSVDNPALEQCVAGRVRTWLFPRPRGGVVVVTYPFLFKPSGE